MSRNHENVIWQSPDGTWNRGFFAEDYLTCGGNEDECGDETHEWCREFDYNRFEWASCGHQTKEAAYRSWDGSNPGGSSEIGYDPNNPASVKRIADLEDVAARLCEEDAQRQPVRAYVWGHGYRTHRAYNGPAKRRTLAAIRRERDALLEDYYRTHVAGYANMLDPREKELTAQIVERLKTATPEEKAEFARMRVEHRDRIADILGKARERRREQARYGGGRFANQYAVTRDKDEREQVLVDKIAEVDAVIARSARQAAEAAAAEAAQAAATPVKKAPAKKSPAKKSPAPPARGKTTAKSTPGSFAPHERAESADVTLTPQTDVSADGLDPWADPFGASP